MFPLVPTKSRAFPLQLFHVRSLLLLLNSLSLHASFPATITRCHPFPASEGCSDGGGSIHIIPEFGGGSLARSLPVSFVRVEINKEPQYVDANECSNAGRGLDTSPVVTPCLSLFAHGCFVFRLCESATGDYSM